MAVAEAKEVALRLRAGIHRAFAAEAVPLHASVGVAAAAARAISGEALLAEADGALYLAKRRGGDRVCTPVAPSPHGASTLT